METGIAAAVLKFLYWFYDKVPNKAKKRREEIEQLQLEKLQHEKRERESTVDSKERADLRLEFVNEVLAGPDLYIANVGQSEARDIRIEFRKGEEVATATEVEKRFPIAVLHPGQRQYAARQKALYPVGADVIYPILRWRDSSSYVELEKKIKLYVPEIYQKKQPR